jgi:hypothetical protein
MTASLGLARVSAQPTKGRHRRDRFLSTQPKILAQLAVIAGVSGAVSAIPISPVLQSVLLIVFSFAGIGSAALCWLELPTAATVAGVIGLSWAGVIAFATSMAWLQLWYPVPGCLLLSLTVAAIGLVRLWSLGYSADREQTVPAAAAPEQDLDSAAAPRLSRIAANVSSGIAFAILLLALGIWALALPMLRRETAGQWGLLVTPGGVLLLTALAIAVTGFAVAIAAHRTITAAAAIVVVITVERVTVPMITEVPIYTWTYKHIGIVDYIVKNDSLPPAGVDVYNQWPAFFTTMAWFGSVTNLDPVIAAHWFGPVADGLLAVLVATLALSFGSTTRAASTAGLLAQVVNWVGQDYYSPQAAAVILCAAILTLLSYSRSSTAAGYASVPIFAVLVPTHQLTPVWVCAVAVVLAICRQMRPRWLATIYVLILAAYLFPRYQVIMKNGGLASFNPFDNSKAVGQGRGSDGRVFSVLVEQGLSVSIWLAAAICFVIIWRRAGAPWALGIMAFSPLALLLALNYGGEAILRVFLYSLLGSSVLIAPFLTKALTFHRAGQRLLPITVSWLALVMAAAAGLQGYYSSWTYITVTRQQLEQSRWLLATNRAGTAITVMAPPAGWPERSTADYVKFALASSSYDNPLDDLRNSLLKGLPTPEAIDNLEAVPADGALYIVLPKQVWAYNAFIGLFPPGALETLVEQLSQRPNWIRVIDDADTLAFVYTPAAR